MNRTKALVALLLLLAVAVGVFVFRTNHDAKLAAAMAHFNQAEAERKQVRSIYRALASDNDDYQKWYDGAAKAGQKRHDAGLSGNASDTELLSYATDEYRNVTKMINAEESYQDDLGKVADFYASLFGASSASKLRDDIATYSTHMNNSVTNWASAIKDIKDATQASINGVDIESETGDTEDHYYTESNLEEKQAGLVQQVIFRNMSALDDRLLASEKKAVQEVRAAK